MLKISSSVTSNSGKKKLNEDNFYANGLYIAENNASSGRIYSDNTQRDVQFYAVFDGLGQDIKSMINPNMDFYEGETAAFAAADMLARLQRHLKTKEDYNLSKSVYNYVRITNKNICEYMRQKSLRTGTSFALLCINGDSAYIYNIGNCKVFMFRENRLVLISQNDTKAESLVMAKQISADIVRHTPDNKILTQYLGMFETEKNLDMHVNRVNIKNGDKFLVCTDGLCDLANERIYQVMSRDMSEQEIVTDLINESMRNGESSGENVTMIVVGVNNSDEIANKANLLKPTADGPTHFNSLRFRNKFEFKPKHIRQIIFAAGALVLFIVSVWLLFSVLFKSDDTNPTGEQNPSQNQSSDQTPADDPNKEGNTGNMVITDEKPSINIETIDPYVTDDETTEDETTTKPPATTTAETVTNAPAVETQPPTPAPTDPPPTDAPTEPPVTEEPTTVATEEITTAVTEAPTETPTEAPTDAPTETPTDAPTELPTEPEPTEIDPPETEPPPAETEPPAVEIEDDTIAADE